MNKYTPDYTNHFRRNRRLLIKRGYDMSKLERTIDALLNGGQMPPKYKDHPLKGNFKGFRECHVDGEGDWLLVYKKHENTLIIAYCDYIFIAILVVPAAVTPEKNAVIAVFFAILSVLLAIRSNLFPKSS